MAPLGVAAIVALQNRSAEFSSVSVAWVPVEGSLGGAIEDVDLALKWSNGTSLIAPPWQGVVQSVQVQVGQTVTDGSAVAMVDGVQRIAWHTPGAFYRTLSLGDEGTDVAWLKQLLISRGAAIDADDQFDWATRNAVRDFADALGAGGETDTFDPTWIVYLPGSIARVQQVDLVVGSPAPSAGESIAKGAPMLLEATLVKASATLQPATGETITPAQALAAYQERVASNGLGIGEADQVSYLGEPLDAMGEPATLDEASLTALASTLSPETASIPVKLTRAAQADEVQVPAAAIATSSGTTVCVRRDGNIVERPVDVVSSSDGGTRVVGDIRNSDSVRVPGPSSSQPCASTSKR